MWKILNDTQLNCTLTFRHGNGLYCWFSHDLTKNSNYKTIDPTETLFSWCIRAAEN